MAIRTVSDEREGGFEEDRPVPPITPERLDEIGEDSDEPSIEDMDEDDGDDED
jgi:hypothetical protein